MKVQTRKQEILKIAAKLFKEKGYSAVTMRDLASEMGIKAASLYNHISSKQEILSVIIISLAERFTNAMELIINDNVTSVEKLKKIIALHVHLSYENYYEMAALNNDWMHLEDQLEYFLKLRSTYEANFKTIIEQGINDKDIKLENPEVILFSMLSTLRTLYLWIPKREALTPEVLDKSLGDVLINGIVNK